MMSPQSSFRAPVSRARQAGRIKRLSSSAGPSGYSVHNSTENVAQFFQPAFAVVLPRRVRGFVLRVLISCVRRTFHAQKRAWKICTCPTEEVSRTTQDVLSLT